MTSRHYLGITDFYLGKGTYGRRRRYVRTWEDTRPSEAIEGAFTMMTAKKPIWIRLVMRLVSPYGRGVNEKFHLRLPEGRTTVPISTPRLLSPVIGRAVVVFVCPFCFFGSSKWSSLKFYLFVYDGDMSCESCVTKNLPTMSHLIELHFFSQSFHSLTSARSSKFWAILRPVGCENFCQSVQCTLDLETLLVFWTVSKSHM